jgi:hypothetical protein
MGGGEWKRESVPVQDVDIEHDAPKAELFERRRQFVDLNRARSSIDQRRASPLA